MGGAVNQRLCYQLKMECVSPPPLLARLVLGCFCHWFRLGGGWKLLEHPKDDMGQRSSRAPSWPLI